MAQKRSRVDRSNGDLQNDGRAGAKSPAHLPREDRQRCADTSCEREMREPNRKSRQLRDGRQPIQAKCWHQKPKYGLSEGKTDQVKAHLQGTNQATNLGKAREITVGVQYIVSVGLVTTESDDEPHYSALRQTKTDRDAAHTIGVCSVGFLSCSHVFWCWFFSPTPTASRDTD